LFAQYYSNPDLMANGLKPTYPGDFLADVQSGALPQVSWVYTTIVQSEHPPAPVTFGEKVTADIVQALTSNAELWKKTALVVTWDENGGFFDHVAPVVAPAGTPGEYVTAATLPEAAQGIRGPIGLGFRVPTLIVSPFARGGFVSSERFDHTSILRLIEARFGAEVPNLSAWRRDVVGDLTAAVNFARVDASVPKLPAVDQADPRVVGSNCTSEPATLIPTFGAQLPGYPVPPNSMPKQEPGAAKRPSGPCGDQNGGRGAHGMRVVTRGMPRVRCGPEGLRIRVDVLGAVGKPDVKVVVNGRRVRTTRRRRFVIRIPARRLKHGRNRIVITARDGAGHSATRASNFRLC